MRPSVLCAVITLVVAAVFYIDGSIPHPLWQFWWLPLVAGLWTFQRTIMACTTVPHITRTVMTIVSGLAALAFILLFNDTTSAYLFGAWMLIGLVAWHYFFAVAGTSYKSLILVSVVSALALLLLPVGVNRITLKLPSLSGQTHFSLHQEIDDAPVASAHYYQRIVEYEELEIHLASQYYPMQADNAPWLQIRDDQEGVIFVIQDVIYEHVLGLFILSLHKIDETGMDSLVLDPASDPVTFFYPNNGGTRIEDLKIGGRAWIKLPAIPDSAIGAREITIVLGVRLLFWILISLTIIGWRPVRVQARPSS